MALDIRLSAGSFTGHVFPVDVDVAYTPDRVQAAVDADVYLYFDDDVLEVVSGSIQPAGSCSSGVITWSGQSLSEGKWEKFEATFQWIDFNAADTTLDAAARLRGGGLATSAPLTVGRPATVPGLKIRRAE